MVKIIFAFEHPVFRKWTVEKVWATLVDAQEQQYRLENIPLYAPFVAYNDIVRCTWDSEQQAPLYSEVTEPSGHSTVQVFRMRDEADMDNLQPDFCIMGCRVDIPHEDYMVIDVPATTDYMLVRETLRSLQEKQVIDFAESCLSAKHYYS